MKNSYILEELIKYDGFSLYNMISPENVATLVGVVTKPAVTIVFII